MTDSVSLVLPVHNEIESLEFVIAEWDHALKVCPDLCYEFVICEDGSTDGTKELILELATKYKILSNSVDHRRGYGVALIDGLATARNDYIMMFDSDGQIGAGGFAEAWSRRDKECFVMGWRYPRRDRRLRLLYSILFRFYHFLLFPNRLHDPSCSLVLGHRDSWARVNHLLGYLNEGFWWGFVGACLKLGIEIIEIKIQHRRRYAGDTQVYKLSKVPGISIRNAVGLLCLRFAPRA